MEEHNLEAGDICLDCQRMGLDKRLRYFYINLEEQILKCENDMCLYPHNDEVSSEYTSEEDTEVFPQLESCSDPNFEAELLSLHSIQPSSEHSVHLDHSQEASQLDLDKSPLQKCNEQTIVSSKEHKSNVEIQLKTTSPKDLYEMKSVPLIASPTTPSKVNETPIGSCVDCKDLDDIPKARISRCVSVQIQPQSRNKPEQTVTIKKKKKGLRSNMKNKQSPDSSKRSFGQTQSVLVEPDVLSEVLELLKKKK